MKEATLLAVYGTLRAGCGNDHYLKHPSVELLGEAKTVPQFTMTSMGGFPVVKTEGNNSIQIEVYKVSDSSVLKKVDRLEGYTGIRDHKDNWYNTVDVETPFGKAKMYVMSPDRYPNLPVIESGDWKKR